jgi:signal transduction histidine kinase
MKASRSVLIWATLVLCGVMVLGAMTWLTRGVLDTEKSRAGAEARADLEEHTRLALWRMDALGATIIARENGYSPDQYGDASLEFWRAVPEDTLLHFGQAADNRIFSPEHHAVQGDASVLFEERVRRLRGMLNAHPSPSGEWALLCQAAAEGEATWQSVPKDAPQEQNFNRDQRSKKSAAQLRQDSTYQDNTNISERAQRAKAIAQSAISQSAAIQNSGTGLGGILAEGVAPSSARSEERLQGQIMSLETRKLAAVGQMRPVWLGEELFLLRQITWDTLDFEGAPLAKKDSVQGVWMNNKALQEILLREIADLLPDAGLVRVEGRQAASDPLTLVSFPFRLVRNESVIPPVSVSPALLIGWIAVLLALLTASLLVHGVMRLSERRASFVSAVTHELRTPLTTFRLYSDMLESGAVREEKRGDYLRVLSREADRLSHLVENVLSFSKIERGSARSAVRESTVRDLLDPMRERLESRLATASLTLRMSTDIDARVRVDAAAVEHILFNLIDNAAKYAATSTPAVVEIQTKVVGQTLGIRVTDHGPGIPVSEHRRIFRAFHKSAREAAETRPGVGLGLALSRRLAKSLGGNLTILESQQGATFLLTLPLA